MGLRAVETGPEVVDGERLRLSSSGRCGGVGQRDLGRVDGADLGVRVASSEVEDGERVDRDHFTTQGSNYHPDINRLENKHKDLHINHLALILAHNTGDYRLATF
ncbi:uncharacterized protein A4U43_C01F16820 [Asparagus officinalis]|uniref:Uncharacterized protein n=1 Tax=Asparagus officinalis TaxID=4686 RepID=A0A5P1FUL5_ASPOF|nr:uncharacterized protein A4U43_C01F16820 [Asparagus officinalis]